MPPVEPGAIIGDVRVLADDQPIFGARVCARASFLNVEYCGYSNITGRFRLGNIPDGNYSVHVTDLVGRYLDNCAGNKACTDPARFGITDGQGAVLSHISLDPTYNQTMPTPTPDPTIGDGVIQGRVFDAASNPIAGSQVCAVHLSLAVTQCATTDNRGAYSVGSLPTGNYHVQFANGDCYGSPFGCVEASPVGVVSPSIRHNISATFG